MKTTLIAILVLGHLVLSSQVKNGLNNSVGAPDTELGGNLIRNTDINLVNSGTSYNFGIGKEGQFRVGNNISSTSLQSYMLNHSSSIFSYTNNSASTGFSALYNTIGVYYRSANNCASTVKGIHLDVDADATSYNLIGNYTGVRGDAVKLYGNQLLVTSRTQGTPTQAYGVHALAEFGASTWGGYFLGRTSTVQTTPYSYGVEGLAQGPHYNTGGVFRASLGTQNYGVYGESNNIPAVNDSYNYGVVGTAIDGMDARNIKLNIGVLGAADAATTSIGVGGYLGAFYQHTAPSVAAAIYGNSTLASTLFTPIYAGYFQGNVKVVGSGASGTYAMDVTGSAYLSSGTLWTTSDRKFKREIKPLGTISERLKSLSVYSYLYNTEAFENFQFEKGEQFGVIAQELREVFPQLVSQHSDGHLVVNYIGLIPVLLQAVKEQSDKIEVLEKKLSNAVMIQEQGGQGAVGFSLGENVPNPFAHSTTIKFELPASVAAANLSIFDLSGKLINSYPLSERGISQVEVSSEKLVPGMYIYSIIADGKIIDVKRMVVSE